MKFVEDSLDSPHVLSSLLAAFWFGRQMKFLDADLLADIMRHGAPVDVSGSGDLRAALSYGHHRVCRYKLLSFPARIARTYGTGVFFMFPRRHTAPVLRGLRISPLEIVATPSNRG